MKADTSIAAYWLATIRRYAAGATLEGATEDDVLRAAIEGIQQGRQTIGKGT